MLLPDFLEMYQAGLYRARMLDSPNRRVRFFHLCQLLKQTRGIEGSTAEAGVFRGLSSLLICETLRRERASFQGENHLMFDSFEGLSQPVEQDGEFPEKRYNEGGFTNTSLEVVGWTLDEFPEVKIAKGWIPQVFDTVPEQAYRFVHVDVDVYEPTLASLKYFFPLLSPGGIIVIDDFGPWAGNNWPGCIQAVNEFAAEIDQDYALLDSGNAFFIKR